MGRHSRPDRRGNSSVAAVTAVYAGIGVALLTLGLGQEYAPSPPVAEVSAPDAARPTPPSASARAEAPAALGRSAPMALTAPAIGLRTSHLVELGLTPDRRLEAPREWGAVGWYSRGAAPGQGGPAVLAGHLDSPTGPAVFHRLGELRDRDTVSVERADGAVVEFTVYAVERHPKNDFPTEDVYGATERPELRLITCGGGFDAATGHYTDNIVVFAALAETPDPG
ncbi:class F sortase [Nocardiopsis protaetiae]|uniref:class F sortase n=1 Tax=Nocardiopsis protaetiae TaxID=3382270 RepID=UPI00387AB16B